jgi:hypothetical protein
LQSAEKIEDLWLIPNKTLQEAIAKINHCSNLFPFIVFDHCRCLKLHEREEISLLPK